MCRRPVPPQVARRDKLVALRAQAMDLVREQGLLQTRASWRIVPLSTASRAKPARGMDGQRLQAPWLVPSSAVSRPWLARVATIGDALEQHVGELFAQRALRWAWRWTAWATSCCSRSRAGCRTAVAEARKRRA